MSDEDITDYVSGRIKTEYDSIENERAAQEGRASPEPCFFNHCGTWDVSFNDIANKVSGAVLAVAQNQQQADKLLTAIFEKVKVVAGEAGGDHHSGYFCEYNVETKDALSLAGNIGGLQQILVKK